MNNLKFCNKLLSLLTINFKKNSLYFDIILTKKIHFLLFIFQKIGIITTFYMFTKFFKKSLKKFLRIFLKYINLEIFFIFPIFFFFKPSHKIPISLKKLKKIDKLSGSASVIISTSNGLMLSNDCIDSSLSGILYLIIYT